MNRWRHLAAMGSYSAYLGMHNGCMMGAVETTAIVMVVGVMNSTMCCANGGPNKGVGRVKVLIRVMVTVGRHSASDG